jgi:P-type Cu2+ transporter
MQMDRDMQKDTNAHPALDDHKMPHDHQGHGRHEGHSVAMFRDKFWLSLALTIPTVIWSPEVQHWLGYTAPSFPGSRFIPAILGTIVFVYGGLVFLRGAKTELADRKPGMMTLISLAIIVAFATSFAATLDLFEIDVWWELASLITIMVLGHWLEMRAISQARGALNALAALLPDTAERVNGAEVQTVPLAELPRGRHCPCTARNSRPSGWSSRRRDCRCGRINDHGRVQGGL